MDALVNPVTRQWDYDMVNAFFQPDTASKILQIPLGGGEIEDFATWPHTKSGTYSVKSAYNSIYLFD